MKRRIVIDIHHLDSWWTNGVRSLVIGLLPLMWRMACDDWQWWIGKWKIHHHHHSMIDRGDIGVWNSITWCSFCLMKGLTFNAFTPTSSTNSNQSVLHHFQMVTTISHVWCDFIFLFLQQELSITFIFFNHNFFNSHLF